MNINCIQTDYDVIVRADLNKNLLAATKDGHFKELGFRERFWRRLKNLVTRHAFDDCKATVVAHAIANFAQTNRSHLNDEQRNKLVAKVNELETHYMKGKTVQAMDFIQAKNLINSTIFAHIPMLQAVKIFKY